MSEVRGDSHKAQWPPRSKVRQMIWLRPRAMRSHQALNETKKADLVISETRKWLGPDHETKGATRMKVPTLCPVLEKHFWYGIGTTFTSLNHTEFFSRDSTEHYLQAHLSTASTGIARVVQPIQYPDRSETICLSGVEAERNRIRRQNFFENYHLPLYQLTFRRKK